MSLTLGAAAAHNGTLSAGEHETLAAEAAAERLVRALSPRAVLLADADEDLAHALRDWGVRLDTLDDPPQTCDVALWLDVSSDLGDATAAPIASELGRRARTVVLRLRFEDASAAHPTMRWLTRLADCGLELDPLADAAFAGPAAMVFRAGAEPLPLAARQGLADAVALRIANGELAAALAQERLQARRHSERSSMLEAQAREARGIQLALESEKRRLQDALREANGVLADELAAVQTAERTVGKDVAALSASWSWRLKLALTRRLKRS